MVTPMVEGKNYDSDPLDVEIDYKSCGALAVNLIRSGSDSIVLSGTTGEAPTTHLNEKGLLIKSVRSALIAEFNNHKIPIIAGVGSNDTKHVIRNCEIAYEAGADALLVVAPYYSRPSQQGLIKHFNLILDRSPLKIILYDVPGRCGVEISDDVYEKLANHKNFYGIKDATGNIDNAKRKFELVNKIRQKNNLSPIKLFCGDDSLLIDFLKIGAEGIISVSSHLIGAEFSRIISDFNNSEDYQSKFEKVLPLINLLNGKGQQAASVKLALKLNGIINNDLMRLPNTAISDSSLSEFVSQFKQIYKEINE